MGQVYGTLVPLVLPTFVPLTESEIPLRCKFTWPDFFILRRNQEIESGECTIEFTRFK